MSTKQDSGKTFKELENELAVIVSRVELGSYVELEDMLRDYEDAKKIIVELENRLKSAKMTIMKSEVKKK
jgi:exonuclease VII small subunit